MIQKHLLRPERLRHVPAGFGWVDHRLVRDGYLTRGDCRAWALYLFLVTVADAQGLSYYSDGAISRRLRLDPVELSAARQQLVQADLLAYQKPLYQILSMPEPDSGSPRSGQASSVADVLRRVLEGDKP